MTIRVNFKGPLVNIAQLRNAVRNAQTAAAKGAKVDFDVTTQTWKSRPSFEIERRGNDTAVFTANKIYLFIDEGTTPHVIRPKNGKVLVFPGGKYTPKTRVRAIASRPGGSSGESVAAKVVHHPGTDAREFSDVIQQKWQKRYPEIMQRSINAAAKVVK